MTAEGIRLSLRERKKLKVMQTIRREAYRLFAERGYHATTVQQIAEAAEVSPSTFFRYYPAKVDLILRDEYDGVFGRALAARPKGEPLIVALRHVLTDSLLTVLAADREELLLRVRLSFTDPTVQALAMDEQLRNQTEIATALAQHLDRPRDLEIECAAAAIIAVSMTVLRHWAATDGTADLTALYGDQLGLLSDGLKL